MGNNYDNDIFKILYPDKNDMICSMSSSDRINILFELKKYYLEKRKTLGLSEDITFGVEIESEESDREAIVSEIGQNFPYNTWIVKDDRSLSHGTEVNSPVLHDNEKTWIDLDKVCNIVGTHAEVLEKTSAHVHIGMHILGNNPRYWRNFVKLWMTYENIITRFLYGEYIAPREKITYYAEPIAQYLIEDLDRIEDRANGINAFNMIKLLNKQDVKRRSVNFRHVGKTELINYDKVANKNTIEFRGGNGTFNVIIWQNYINLLTKLLLYATREDFNDEVINKRLRMIIDNKIPSSLYKYSQIHIEQAFEFADLIFTNNLDKVYFLRQYFKDMHVNMEPLTLSESFCRR